MRRDPPIRPPGFLALLILFVAPPVVAQGTVDRQLRDNQQKLEEIRRERDRLQDDLEKIRNRAHNISSELTNLEGQKRVTGRIVNELDRQIGSMRFQLDTLTVELILTQDALAEKRAVLERRLEEIYKRGSLWTFQALFAAENFGDLVSRYKYLYLVSRQDRALVADVEQLRNNIAEQRQTLLNVRLELSRRRDERGQELTQFQRLERARQVSLQRTKASEREAANRLASLGKDEQRITDLVNALERARRAALAAAPAAATRGTIKSDDVRSLDWPVDGEIIYPFGMMKLANRSTILRNGVGLKVPVGTPVKTIEAGTVVLAGAFGTYGPTVTISHGGGFYTLYLYLSRVDVRLNQYIARGTIIGLSGGANSDEGPHIEFQIREAEGGNNAIALDPVNWLKNRKARS